MVSIIVTHKKGLSYLRDCLESISEQQFQDYETILVIDGNEDDVSDLIKRYQDSINLSVFSLEKKHGVSAARNLGLDNAKGEYIYFLDSDDYLQRDTIRELVSVMTDKDDLSYGNIGYTWFQKKAFHPSQKGKDEENAFPDEREGTYPPEDIFAFRYEKYKKLETITVLGVLYRKSFLERHQIRFEEGQLYYADAPFFTKVMYFIKGYQYSPKSLYVKRYHNDKEKNPSINQTEDEARETYYLESYRSSLKSAADNTRLKAHLELILCKYFVRYYAPRFHWDKSPKWEKENLVPFQREIAKINKKSLKSMKPLQKILIGKVRNNNVRAIKRWTNIMLIKKKLVKMFTDKEQFFKAVNLHIFQKMGIKENWITFESFVGRNYSGQPKYIYQYLQKEYGKRYRYIWIVDKRGMKIDGKHKTVKRFGIQYFYYMSRSKYWVNNMRQPSWLPKKKGQIMLETWHGTPLKKLVFDMEDVHAVNPHYKAIVYKQSRGWDYLLSDNPFSTEKFQSCFRFDKEKILEVGYPANDPLYAPNLQEQASVIKKKLKIPADKKVLLYAPTWRDDNYYDAGEYKFELALDIERLKKEFADQYVVLLRMHYWIVDRLDLSGYEGFIYNVSDYDDITELYMISDICMTDYSSVFFDFANLKRPILYYTYDFDKYRDVLRGFYLDMETELPGPLLFTNDEVVEALKNIDEISEQYKNRYNAFYDKFCCIDDGNAARRVVEAVFGE